MTEKVTPTTKRPWVRPLILALVVGTLFVLSRVFKLGSDVAALRDWFEALGWPGIVLFIALYAAATVAAIPGTAITVIAGILYGSLLGVVVVSAGSTLGASLTFLISRYFARDSLAQWLSGKESFRKLDKLTAEHGATIVALTRLVPIFPFNLLNYGFGLTRVPFGQYIFWSWLCMLPGTILYVVGADTIARAIAQGRIPWILVGILALILVLLIVLVRYARSILRRKQETVEKPSPDERENDDYQ